MATVCCGNGCRLCQSRPGSDWTKERRSEGRSDRTECLSKLAHISKAGLVSSTVDRAGVIRLFKDTVDLFSLILDSRHLGRDYEILDTKLDIEKMILLQWADRVKLLSSSYDKRLDDRDAQRLITKILECVATLLTNAPELQQRYGMNKVPADSLTPENGAALVSGTLRVSDARWERFLKDYNDLNTSSVPTGKRVRWMIRDKQKFEGLIQGLVYFTTRLNEVIPVVLDDASTRIMTGEDLEAIGNLRGLKILLEASKALQNTIMELTQHVLSEKCKDHILNKLRFRNIDDRRESIPLAHKKTLRWALEPPKEEFSWDDLSMWLRSGSGIFWVVGKAGSGKSTLMKYLYLSDSTRTLLSKWARKERYFICNFFFMNLGTVEQKSQEGLSRTLLYQILSANRGLIPEVLPHMWKEIYETEHKNGPDDINLPSQAETRRAFSLISSSNEGIGRFCFFIDGLDEFIGDYRDSIAFIKDLAANEHIKVIVSSRPIPDCVEAFKDLPKLRLEDLNRDDISLYVNDNISSHEYMRKLMCRSPEECEKIIKDIIDKSSGVFLWVVLACRSLLSGFADYDNISELRRCVDELPPELEEMFQHMLGKIKPRHMEQGARLLRICYTHQTAPWPNASLDIYAVGLALIQDYNTSPVRIEYLPDEYKYDLCKALEGRLRSRCGGLLEVSRHSEMACLCSTRCSGHANCTNIRVLFMHRTVFEFLSNEQVWEIECLRLPPGKPFDPNTALSLYGLHLTKQSLHVHHERRSAEHTASLLWEGLRWAVLADSQDHGGRATFFNSLSAITEDPALNCLRVFEPSLKCFYTQARVNRCHPETRVSLLLAIEAGAVNYVRKHPDLQALVQHEGNGCSCKPVLLHAISRSILDATFQTSASSKGDGANVPSQDIVSLLLRSGCDPNQEYGRRTLWKVLIDRMDRWISDCNASGVGKWVELIESFLEAGADLEALDLYKAKWATLNGQCIFQRSLRKELIDPVASLGAKRVNSDEKLELEGSRVVKRPRLSENATSSIKVADPEHQKSKNFMSSIKFAFKSGLQKKEPNRLGQSPEPLYLHQR
ncbi:hypothetical protein IQ07DRAFT_360507 [Pyrenochaeta sp. DS3sAY3a]|nr:hypothetical protein IQ07DRAFT_360507 [Pyrenochaeta sp. DS3sAY3a]